MLKTFTINFSDISEDFYLRTDSKYHSFLFSSDWNLFNSKNNNLIALKNILSDDYVLFDYKKNEHYKGIPTGQTYIDKDGEIIDFKTITLEDHPARLKYKISNQNILISSLRLAKSPALFFENKNLSNYVFSNGFYIFDVKKTWNIKFVLYILRTKKLKDILDNNVYRGIGISAYKKEDLLKIKIPLIAKPKQDQIVAQIEPIEKKIKELKAQIIQPQKIINKVFAKEFGFDENLYNQFGKGMTAGTQIAENRKLRVFKTVFSEFTKSDILRCSTRFSNPANRKLTNILNNIKTLTIKNILTRPIRRGASPKYNPDGDIPVVKTGHLKNGYIEISQEEFVDNTFYNSSIRSQIKKGDILIASTGKISLGKIDLLEEKQKLAADGHISIIKINDKKYNCLFFIYFFRSVLGYFQIERDFTGTTNQIELGVNEISNFKIPNIPLPAQQKIVDEIKSELENQEQLEKQIKNQRNNIDRLIENIIRVC